MIGAGKLDRKVILQQNGAEEELIKNGDFSQLGSDLVQNGDFAEIGSELVTNGDFSAVPLTGGELVVNGDFAADTNWNINVPPWSISGGEAISDGAGSGSINQSSILTEGVFYKISFEITEYTSGSGYRIRAGAGQDYSVAQTSLGVHTFYQVAKGNPLYATTLYIIPEGNTIGKITNVSVVEAVNLITNPNFSATGSELVTDGDFSSSANWYEGTGCTISGNQGVFTSAPSGSGFTGNNLNAAICVVEKSYKVTYTIDSITSGSVGLRHPFTGTYYDNTSSFPLDVTEYVVADDSDIYIQNSGTTTATISNVSVKELGADWDDSGTPLKAATFDVNGLTITSVNGDGNNNRVSQANVTEAAKSYKVTYTIHSATLSGSNVFQYYNGATYVTFSEQGVGTHTFYFTRENAENGWYFRVATYDGSTTDFVTISSIVVQELGEGWAVGDKWSLSDEGARLVSSTSAASGLSQSDIFEIGKSYKVTLDSVVNSGTAKLEKSAGGTQFQITETKTYVEYFEATRTDFYLNRVTTDSDIYINNITVKEVGQDWTPYTSGTSTVAFPSTGAELNIDALNSNVGVYQTGIFTLGKSYKIVLSMKATSSFDAEVVESSGAATESTIGTVSLTTEFQTFSLYHLGTGTFDLFIHRLYTETLGASQTITIQSVTVQQLDPNDYWTLETGWSIGGDKVIANTTGTEQLYQDVSLVTGKTYKITYTVGDYSSGVMYLYLQTNGFIGSGTQENKTVTQSVKYEGTDGILYFRGSPNASCSITDILVKDINPQDAFGQPLQTWTDIATLPCRKKDLLSSSSKEVEVADQPQTKTVAEFTIRYRSDLTGTERLKFEDEIYEIVRIAERGRRRYQMIIAFALDSTILD